MSATLKAGKPFEIVFPGAAVHTITAETFTVDVGYTLLLREGLHRHTNREHDMAEEVWPCPAEECAQLQRTICSGQ